MCVCLAVCVCVTDRVLTSTPSGGPLPNSFYLMCHLESLKAEVAPPLFLPTPGSRVWLGTCRGRTTKDDSGLTRGRWKGGWVCVCVLLLCVCVPPIGSLPPPLQVARFRTPFSCCVNWNLLKRTSHRLSSSPKPGSRVWLGIGSLPPPLQVARFRTPFM